jgi:hypothetical protein
MQSNRLTAIVAGSPEIGYHSGMPEKEREQKFKEARDIIEKASDGKDVGNYTGVINMTLIGINAFNGFRADVEEKMIDLVKTLPIHKWIEDKAQRGIASQMLATIIGEAGDLGNYSNPGKLWRRFGCAPWTFDKQTLMGATWKSGREGKLPAEEWEKFGYSPRRRSIAFLIGDLIVKQNKDIYRKRYDDAKAAAKKAHTDWPDNRCHRHAMLLATKLFLKNLWIEWSR